MVRARLDYFVLTVSLLLKYGTLCWWKSKLWAEWVSEWVLKHRKECLASTRRWMRSTRLFHSSTRLAHFFTTKCRCPKLPPLWMPAERRWSMAGLFNTRENSCCNHLLVVESKIIGRFDRYATRNQIDREWMNFTIINQSSQIIKIYFGSNGTMAIEWINRYARPFFCWRAMGDPLAVMLRFRVEYHLVRYGSVQVKTLWVS